MDVLLSMMFRGRWWRVRVGVGVGVMGGVGVGVEVMGMGEVMGEEG